MKTRSGARSAPPRKPNTNRRRAGAEPRVVEGPLRLHGSPAEKMKGLENQIPGTKKYSRQ